LLCTEPHCYSGVGSGSVFTGSYDWHSSVHAHWALLSMARLTQDESLERTLSARLIAENLEAERVFLFQAENTEFEMPYGRAWLLLMLAESSKHPGINYGNMGIFREQLEQQLTSWLELHAFSHEIILNGNYESWLFVFLLLHFSQPTSAIRHRIEALRPHIEVVRHLIAAMQGDEYDFLYLPALLFLFDWNGEMKSGDFPCGDGTPPQFDQILNIKNCHQAGANVVRLWPHALDQQDGSDGSRFCEGMEQILARPEHWKSSFELVSHWVPQFIWLGLMLERGELLEHQQRESTATV
jgi:hypothetical protein